VKPVPYVKLLEDRYRRMGFPPYRWTVFDDAPLTPLAKPLAACRVTALTSGGISHCSAQPWDPIARNDFRLDTLSRDTPANEFQIHDAYYEHEDAERDVNCVFPIERLRELAEEGVIGEVAPRLYSGFMGRIYKRTELLEKHAPAFAGELQSQEVDLALLVPA
jgi:D-proline reductase (dithiol) PrdB